MTSSLDTVTSEISRDGPPTILKPEDWPADVEKSGNHYVRASTLAEKAARDYAQDIVDCSF